MAKKKPNKSDRYLRLLILERFKNRGQIEGSDTETLMEALGLVNAPSKKEFDRAFKRLLKSGDIIQSDDTYRLKR